MADAKNMNSKMGKNSDRLDMAIRTPPTTIKADTAFRASSGESTNTHHSENHGRI
jgi:hypothetical protein